MTFEAEAGGRSRTVRVQKTPGGWRVELDGRVLMVGVEAAGPRWSMLVQSAAGGAWTSWEVTATAGRAGERVLSVNGHAVPVRYGLQGQPGGRRAGTAAAASAGPVPVPSPMPGRVVAVLVKPGDDVAARDGLVVVEAMKMENEIRAPRAGRVRTVHVVAGDAVEAQTVLVVIE